MANFRRIARRKANKYGLDPNIFVRQINQESGFNPDVIFGRRSSPAGAQGIAQIMPATAQGWGVDPLKPRQALDAAAKHMAGYVDQFGSYGDALRAYNAGPGNVQASHGFSETNNYVSSILNGRDPGGLNQPSSPQPARQNQRNNATRTVTTTTPGVDNHAARAGVLLQYLQQRKQPGALLTLINGIQSAQDIPSTTSTKQVPAAGNQNGNPTGGGRLFYVGDSLGVGTSPDVNATGRNVKVGRSSQQSLSILRNKVANGFQGRVVFDAGTNDGSAADLRRSLAQAKQLGVQLYVPTITGGPDAQAKNRVIRQMAGGNLHVVDTSSLAPDAGDSVHYSPQGYQQRAQIIQQAVGGSRNGGGGGGRFGQPSDLRELFYNGPGGVNVDEGKRVGTGFVEGHTDHVHVAGNTRAENMRLARLAQRLGLTIREFAPFDHVDPVHATNSFHYSKAGALDVSGDPAAMAKFSRKAARRFGA